MTGAVKLAADGGSVVEPADTGQNARLVRVYNFGCRKNLQIGETLKVYCLQNGYEATDDTALADLTIINTCAFDQDSEDRAADSIRLAHATKKPGSRILVSGCLPSINHDLTTAIHDGPAFDQGHYREIESHVPPIVTRIDSIPLPHTVSFPSAFERLVRVYRRTQGAARFLRYLVDYLIDAGLGTQHWSGRFYDSKTFLLQINHGCLNRCSYCSIPNSVGPLSSRPVEAIIKEFRKGLETGHRTFALTSDDTGCYGRDICTSLSQLLIGMLSTAGEYAISVPNLNPRWLVRDRATLLAALSDSRVGEISIPIESGSNRILALMGRAYSIEPVLEVLRDLRSRAERTRLCTQVIVGFPTETLSDFEATCDVIRSGPFDFVDVFEYSDRPGSRASGLQPKVSDAEKQRRYRVAKSLVRGTTLSRRLGLRRARSARPARARGPQ